MKKTLDHAVVSSLKEFLNFSTIRDLEAFSNHTEQLFRYDDKKFPNKVAYGSPYAGWNYNIVPGAIVPTGVGPYGRGDSGLVLDFKYGRVLFDKPFAPQNLSATFSVPEIQYYVSSNPDYSLIFETQYGQNPDQGARTGASRPYSFTVPCVFVKSFQTNNEPCCFGGEDWTIWRFKIIALMSSESYLIGIQKIIRDCKNQMFPLLRNYALNQYNDIKDVSWNYEDFMRDNEYRAWITDSTFKIEENDLFTSNNPKLYVGIGNIEVRLERTPGVANSEIDLSRNVALTDIDDDFNTDDEDDFILS